MVACCMVLITFNLKLLLIVQRCNMISLSVMISCDTNNRQHCINKFIKSFAIIIYYFCLQLMYAVSVAVLLSKTWCW